MAISKRARDAGKFKTPTLRALTETGPYMHDGSLTTLREVVEFYRRGGNPNPGLDRKIRPLDLSDREVDNLLAFLRALSRSVPERSAEPKKTPVRQGK
jgi:cytochrome c peroxidase